MLKVVRNRYLLAIVLAVCVNLNVYADEGAPLSFTPYSIYGVGDLLSQGSAYNNTMGGVGIASSSHRFINPLNPAAVSSRDSLSFMVDFSLVQKNKYFHQGDLSSVNNTFSIGDCIISFPIYRSLAMMVGVMPYSGTGYSYTINETDKKTISALGNVSYYFKGLGSLYQLFGGLGFSPLKNFTIGAEAIYYFGSIEKTNAVTYGLDACPDITNTNTAVLNGVTGKFGAQYEIKFGPRARLGLGATYKLSTPMKGDIEYLSISTKLDTLCSDFGGARFADEIGAGISFGLGDKLFLEFDYTRADWRSSGLDNSRFFAVKEVANPFETAVQQSFRFGFEYVPNRSDVRYFFKRIAYRAGAYYSTEYYTMGGQNIASRGITLGMTLPVYRWYNGVTLGVDFGQRGTMQKGLIKENYINFAISVNLFDIWFQKYRYE